MPQNKPNIIYILADQHRHDALGCAGNPIIQTPNLDRLAARGVRFSNCLTQSPVCQPARASVITGRYTHQTGISRNNQSHFDANWPNLMKNLKQEGYSTYLSGKTHYLILRGADIGQGRKVDLREHQERIAAFGFDRVMEEFDRYAHAHDAVLTPYTEYLKERGLYEPYRDAVRSIYRLTPTHWDARVSPLAAEHEETSFIMDRAMDFIREHDGSRPFYLNIGIVAPHVPLMADAGWAARYQDAPLARRVSAPPRRPGKIWSAYMDKLEKHSNSHLLNDEYVTAGARQYYGMISLIDEKIGQLARLLEERGLAENTWIVYSADHGELMGEHNLMGKSCFYRPAVQVPAIITPPAGEPEQALVEDGLVELGDLSATILDIAGARDLPGSSAISLKPFLEGRGQARPAAFSAISTGACPYYFFCVREEQFRLTVEVNSMTPTELFDLAADPDEELNLVDAPEAQAVIQRMVEERLRPHLALGQGV